MTAIKMGLTIEEAAECTGIGRNTMRKLVDWGKLPVLKVGRKTIIRRDTLERFMTVKSGQESPQSKRCTKSGITVLQSPRRLRAKYAPRTNLRLLLWAISPLRGACITTSDTITSVMIQRKLHRNFRCCPPITDSCNSHTDKSVA